MLDVLVRKMERRDELSVGERDALNRLPMERRHVAAGDFIVREGAHVSRSLLLISGFAGRVSLVADGGRQFTELGIAGDFMDLHGLLMKRLDHGVLALSPCELLAVPHDALTEVLADYPHLTRLLWLETAVDAAIHRTWMVGLGRKDAQSRMAHLLCETFVRLEAVGLVSDSGFDFPLSQIELADLLGLSSVHVNRILMALRADGLIDWRQKRVTIRNWDRLAASAEFDPLYLRLWKEPV